MAGLAYFLMFVAGGIAAFARRGIFVAGDAAATATNIMAHESMYRLSFAGELLVVAIYVGVVALFYDLFRPVNRRIAFLTALFGLMGCAIQATSTLFYLAPTVVLGGAKYLSVFSVQQLQAQASVFLKLYSQGYGIALVFFAFFMLGTGYLILKSTFLPRFIGVLLMIAGAAGLTFLFPGFASPHLAWIAPFFVGEVVITFWLLIKGVNATYPHP
jgi:hypothetical protein